MWNMHLLVAVSLELARFMPWLTVSLEKRLSSRNPNTMWPWMIDFWETLRFQIQLHDANNSMSSRQKLKRTMLKSSKLTCESVGTLGGSPGTRTRKRRKHCLPSPHSKASIAHQICCHRRRHRYLRASRRTSLIWFGVSLTCSSHPSSISKMSLYLKWTMLTTYPRLRRRRTRRMTAA